MKGCALIIAATEGFIVKGIETKLKGIDVESEYAAPTLSDIGAKCDNAGLFIILTDEDVRKFPEVMVYIKDHCAEKEKQVIVIGTKVEYDTLTGFIPASYVFAFYERPLEMEVLVSGVEKYLEEEEQMARRKSILIVDDDVAYMSMIMGWLKDKYRVSLANSGLQTITWLAKNHADLILLDYEMPVTTGPHVLEMIRSDPELADIPVMFLTGKGDKESIMKVLSLKPVGYLLKTIERKDLMDNIYNFFAAQKAQEET